MFIRLIKSLVVLTVALYFFIVAYDNSIDFDTNFIFVKHVLTMDTISKSQSLACRAIANSKIEKLIYEFIIVVEFSIAALCFLSSSLLVYNSNNKKLFKKIKPLALFSIFSGFIYFFVGFIIVAGEWFCTWQSKTANSQAVAGMFSTILMLLLIFLNQEEQEQ